MGYKLTPDRIIAELETRGLDITRRTLLNWEKAGLIPKAKRGSYGQGGGKWADYPAETIPEALAAQLLKKVFSRTNAQIAKARSDRKAGDLNWWSVMWNDLRVLSKDYNYPELYTVTKKAYDEGLFPLVSANIFRNWVKKQID